MPFGEDEDSFTVTFDPETHLMRTMEALRYRDATDEAKIDWLLAALECDSFHRVLRPSLASVTWEDDGTPWLVIRLDGVVYNVDIEEYIRARGA